MSALTLWQRLALVFAALLLACFGAAAALQMGHSARLAQRVEQQLLRQLAMHVAAEMAMLAHRQAPGSDSSSPLQAVVERLRVTNPGVDLYVLDASGRIHQRYPETAALQRQQVRLAPLRDFLAGKPPPVLGDDPLSAQGSKVFSAAALTLPGLPAGYVYVVLQGTAHDMAVADAGPQGALQIALGSIGLVTPLGLLAGLLSFRWVTRPLSQLTAEIQGAQAATHHAHPPGVPADEAAGEPVLPRRTRDEIAILRQAFERLVRRNQRQWQSLASQDQQRREWLAHISHDLRTPLATLQGYLETVLLHSARLSDAEREQHLRTALSESQRLGRLAQALLDLARLEMGAVRPNLERFALDELVQDVIQKLALSAAARHKRLVPDVEPGLRPVLADIGMIERVLTNLLDNAIRHTPDGGEVRVRLRPAGEQLRVAVADNGPGIPDALRAELFAPTRQRRAGRDGGGLGLAVVQQMLLLHGSSLQLHDEAGCGAVFVFHLPVPA